MPTFSVLNRPSYLSRYVIFPPGFAARPAELWLAGPRYTLLKSGWHTFEQFIHTSPQKLPARREPAMVFIKAHVLPSSLHLSYIPKHLTQNHSKPTISALMASFLAAFTSQLVHCDRCVRRIMLMRKEAQCLLAAVHNTMLNYEPVAGNSVSLSFSYTPSRLVEIAEDSSSTAKSQGQLMHRSGAQLHLLTRGGRRTIPVMR